ncbi:MAG: hypothetical protein HC828_18175, partial [Blastochloris sp.]|nr:hypothetical protein [Blastochloris sp.]
RDILQAPAMIDDNPFGTGYGYGHTGQSRGWLQQEIDLSTYAGGEVLVRFEYVTDDATLGSGFLLDDVSISELGFSDDFEAPSDTWTAEGWVLSDNRLPQHFSIHLVQRTTDGVEVTRLLDDLGVNPTRLYTSPLLRARQTADILGQALGVAPVVRAEVAPGFDVARLEGLTRDLGLDDELMLVGHEPDFSGVVSALIGGGRVSVKKGGVARVDLIGYLPLRGELVWLLAPKVFHRLG